VAGGGSDSPSTDGTKALSTALDLPSGLAVDPSGNVVVADTDDLAVEVLAGSATDPAYSLGSGAVWEPGYLYVVAGGGESAPSVTGTSADETGIDSPEGVVTDGSGNVLIADGASGEVLILAVSNFDPGYLIASGATWTTGDVFALVGSGDQMPSASGTEGLLTQLGQTDGIAVSPSGGIAVADTGDSDIEFLQRVPVPPELESATAGNASVALGWSAPATDGGSPVTGYDVLVFSGGSSSPAATLAFGASTTSGIVEDLTNGVPYSFEVEATNAIGTSQPSSSLGATPNEVTPNGATPTGATPNGATPNGATPNAPPSSHGGGHKVRPRLVLTKATAPVKSELATLSLKCNTQLCRGELQLVAHKDVRFTLDGRTHTETETVLVSSGHFSVQGEAVVSLPVRVAGSAIGVLTKSRHYRIVVAASFAVTKGAKSTYELTLVAR